MSDNKYLEDMSRMDIEKIDRNELVNLQEVVIDAEQPVRERILCYLEQIKNPYCFRCGDIPVKITFSSDGGEITELLKKHFIALKQ